MFPDVLCPQLLFSTALFYLTDLMNSCFSLKTLYLYKVKHHLEKQKSNPPTAYIILKYHTVPYFSTVMTVLIIWTLVKTDTGYF